MNLFNGDSRKNKISIEINGSSERNLRGQKSSRQSSTIIILEFNSFSLFQEEKFPKTASIISM